MSDRLLVDLAGDDQVGVLFWPDGGSPEELSRGSLAWPLPGDVLEDLRWYLEDYLTAPFGVWGDRGPAVRGKLAIWGEQVFESVFHDGPLRHVYERGRDRGVEVVFRSADSRLLGLPWELMWDGTGPVALQTGGISRSIPVPDHARTLQIPGGKLRVLMVISRPDGTRDVEYQMVARPLLDRLDAVRGEVELTVLRPPTLGRLRDVVRDAANDGRPFHIVHFDCHGAMLRSASGSQGVLSFELPGGGSNPVGAPKVARVLAEGNVPVVVLNACRSGTVGKELEASVATAMLRAGCAAVVGMAYNVHKVAAAEFMAAFYESLFTGQNVAHAVTSGRRRLFGHDGRPSPKGDMPLADWLVPVHYLRHEVRFPDARICRPVTRPSTDAAPNRVRTASVESPRSQETEAAQDPLAPSAGVFVGRDDLFYALEAAADQQRVIALTGPGGTGKTELAKGFARWRRDTGGIDDAHLVFWHSFEPGIASFSLEGMITAFGRKVINADFDRLEPLQQLTEVKKKLAQSRCLLVWDNFEAVREMPDPSGATPPLDEVGCAQLREFLQWVRDHSHSTVIVTSRTSEDWLGEVRRIEVGTLNRTEASEYAGLLLAPFPIARERREKRSFGDLLEWLDGHPLAMRLTLPHLEVTDPTDLLVSLHGTAPLSRGRDAGQDRLSSLGTCIAYSYAHLAESTKRLLPVLSLFHGTAYVRLLAALSAAEGCPDRFAGAGPGRWTAALENATEVGLLSKICDNVYRIHPALPGYLASAWHDGNPGEYAQERLRAEQSLRAACCEFCQQLTVQITYGYATSAYAFIDLHRRTLGSMLRHALEHNAWDDATGIVKALDAYWQVEGLDREAAAWDDLVLAATSDSGLGPIESAGSLWLYAIGKQAARQRNAGHPDQAVQLYRRMLDWLEEQPETQVTRGNIGGIYRNLGDTAQVRGRPGEAEEWYRKSLPLIEELGVRSWMAKGYHALGMAIQDQGRLDEAESWHLKAISIAKEFGDKPGLAVYYNGIGNNSWQQGRLDEAKSWYGKAFAVNEEIGNRPGMAGCYHQLGNIAHRRGRLDEAENSYLEALAIAEEISDRPCIALSYHQLGTTAEGRERLGEAESWYRKAVTVNEEIGDLRTLAATYSQLGKLAYTRHRPHQALDWIIKSVTLFDEFPSLLAEPDPWRLSQLANQLGLPVLREAWHQITGQPVPQPVLDYIANQANSALEEEP